MVEPPVSQCFCDVPDFMHWMMQIRLGACALLTASRQRAWAGPIPSAASTGAIFRQHSRSRILYCRWWTVARFELQWGVDQCFNWPCLLVVAIRGTNAIFEPHLGWTLAPLKAGLSTQSACIQSGSGIQGRQQNQIHCCPCVLGRRGRPVLSPRGSFRNPLHQNELNVL